MAFAPQYNGAQYNGQRMRQLPFVPEDPRAASAAYQQAGQFAQGLSATGNALILEATAQQNRINETFVTDAVNKAKLEIMQKEADILSMTGPEAQQIPGMLQELYSSTYGKFGGGLVNSRMKEMFALRTENAVQGAIQRGTRASIIQMNKHFNDSMSLEAQTDRQELQRALRPDGGGVSSGWITTVDAPVVTTQPEGSLSVSRASPGTVVPAGVPANVNTVAYEQLPDYQATLVNPENGQIVPPINPVAVVQRTIERSNNRIAEMFAGTDPRVIADRQRDAEAGIHAMAIQELSMYDPRQAKAYMEQESVRAVMPPGMMLEIREKLQYSVEIVDAGEDAQRTFAEIDPKDPAAMENARMRAYTEPRYKANTNARKQYLAVLEANADRRTAQERVAKIQGIKDLSVKMMDADFDFNNLSPEEQHSLLLDGDGEDTAYQAFTRLKEFRKMAAAEGMGADMSFYEEMRMGEARNPGYIAEWLDGQSIRPGGRIVELTEKLGGDKAMIKEFIDLATKSVSSGTAGGGSGRAASVSADFNWGTSFEGLWSKSELEEGDERDFRKNGFIAMGNQLIAEMEENVLKRKATFKEKNDIAQQLYRNVEAGLIDVTLPYFKQSEQAAALLNREDGGSTRIEVDVGTLPLSERLQNRGEDVVNLSPALGAAAQNFGNIRPDDRRQLPPAVIEEAATEVLRAYAPGEIAEIRYEPDDLIVYDKDGFIQIFSPEGIAKSGYIEERVPPSMEATRSAMETAELERGALENEKRGDRNLLKNQRAEAVRELKRIRRDSGETPGIATQRVLARREKQIQNFDRAVRSLNGENDEAEYAKEVIEVKMQELDRLTAKLNSLIENGKIVEAQIRFSMPQIAGQRKQYLIENNLRIAEVEKQIAVLRRDME